MTSTTRRGAAMDRWFTFFAVGTLVTGFLAVGLGGVVRITGSGLGCPDWPVCYGSFIPPMQLEAWIEYIHRLGGALVGFFGIGVLVLAFVNRRVSGSTRGLVVLAALLYVVQVLLGAATVFWEIPPEVAASHFAFATALLGTLALVVAASLGGLQRVTAAAQVARQRGVRVDRYALGMAGFAVLAFLTVIAGTVLTRSGGAAVCTGFPFCDTFAATETIARLQDWHMLHRYLGYAAFFAGLGMVVWTFRLGIPGLRGWGAWLGLVVSLQVFFGVMNILLQLPQWSRAGHVLFATVLFATVMLILGAVWPARRAATAEAAPDVAGDEPVLAGAGR